MDPSSVNTNPHVDIDPSDFSHQPKETQCMSYDISVTLGTSLTYAIASIMSIPSSTQQWAWSGLGSGIPQTQ